MKDYLFLFITFLFLFENPTVFLPVLFFLILEVIKEGAFLLLIK
jgi:hypothetical protein